MVSNLGPLRTGSACPYGAAMGAAGQPCTREPVSSFLGMWLSVLRSPKSRPAWAESHRTASPTEGFVVEGRVAPPASVTVPVEA